MGARVGQINEVEEMDGASGGGVFEDDAALEAAAGAAGAAAGGQEDGKEDEDKEEEEEEEAMKVKVRSAPKGPTKIEREQQEFCTCHIVSCVNTVSEGGAKTDRTGETRTIRRKGA